MLIAYWIVAGLLAALYLFAGVTKIVRSKEQLLPMMQWVAETPMPAVRTIGTLEVLGAIGLILPPLTGILPGLALAAAVAFVLLQIGAIVVHLRRGDRTIAINIVALVLAGVATWLATVRL